jgi:hypothetical protein
VGLSVIEDRQVKLAQAGGVGYRVDLDDLPVCERESEYPEQPSTRSHDDSGRAVHERRLCEPGTPRERERLSGPGLPQTPRSAGGGEVGPDSDVRSSTAERVEVTCQAAKEGVDDSLARKDRANCRGRSLHPARLWRCAAVENVLCERSRRRTANMSYSTASRSAGASISSTTSSETDGLG